MKRFITTVAAFAFAFLVSSNSFAQIPNAGFENWTNGEPDGWDALSNFGGSIMPMTKSTDAHSGTSALRGDVISVSGGIFSPLLMAGQGGDGVPCNSHIGSLTGYYKFVPAASSGDAFEADVIAFKGGWITGAIGTGIIQLSASTTTYTKFTVPITYYANGTPDSCYIMFAIVAGPGASDPKVGSYFIIDDISFGPVTGIADNGKGEPVELKLNQNYPNPFNPSTDISFSIPSNGRATLKVFNVMGQEVATLFNQAVTSGNSYHATFSGARLASGLYFSRLQFISTDGIIKESVGKMILAK